MKIKKILVSQPKPTTEKSPYFDLAEEFGLKLEFKSFIKVEGVTAKEFRQERINILDFTGIVFTSRTAIDHFFRICTEMRVTVPDTMKYFCISEAIAFYLQKYIVYRKRKIFYGDKKVEDMTKILLKHKTENFLVPVSDVHKENIPALMDELHLKYTKSVFYKTVSSDVASEIPDLKEYDILAFYTPAGIKSLFHNYPNFEQGSTIIAAFGEATAEAVEEAGLRLDIKAPTEKAPSMTMALEQFIKAYNKEMDIKRCPFFVCLHSYMDEMIKYTFCKEERLCRKGGFEELLSSGYSFVSYPLRVVIRLYPRGEKDFPARIAVSVSKRRFKRAVKRNRVKRLIRETYRLNKNILYSYIPEDKTMDILFIYLHDEIFEYGKIEKAITGAIKKIRSYIEKDGSGDIADTH